MAKNTALGAEKSKKRTPPKPYSEDTRKRQILMRSDTKLPQPFASWSNSL